MLVTLDPTNRPRGLDPGSGRAVRPSSLAGHTLGIVANGLWHSEPMFDVLAARLGEEDGLAGVVKVVKPSVAVPAWPDQWATITDRATVAVTGFGGCGSCSTRSMRDALELERSGIPAVCVVHAALVPAVEALCQLVGAVDRPYVVVDYPHSPAAKWTGEEAAAVAREVLPLVRRSLTR